MPDLNLVTRIYAALVVCFLMGLAAGLLIWVWRRRAERAETERIRLESEAQGQRLKLRISALGEIESEAKKVKAELAALKDKANDSDTADTSTEANEDDEDHDSEELEALKDELAALQEKVGHTTKLEKQVEQLRAEIDKGVPLKVEAKELQDRNRKLEQELAAARTDLATARSDVERYSDRLSETEQEVDGLKAGGTASSSDADETTVLGTALPSYKDDLKKINGIGPVLEQTLNGLGIQTWEQIANLTPEQIEMVQDAIGSFKGRLKRDDWIGGARQLIADQ